MKREITLKFKKKKRALNFDLAHKIDLLKMKF